MGCKNLRLVVTDGGNGISYDHADWAEAKVSCEVVAAPANLKATPSPGGIVLNWDASTQSNLAGYQVARAAQAGGPFTTLTTTNLSAATSNDMAAPQGAVSYYQVVAVSRSGKLSPPSSISATRPARTRFSDGVQLYRYCQSAVQRLRGAGPGTRRQAVYLWRL